MAKLRILAPLLGIPFDHLRQRDRERKRSRLLRLGALFISATLCFGVITGAYLYQRQIVSNAARLRGEQLTLGRLLAEERTRVSRPPPFREASPVWIASADISVGGIEEQHAARTNGLPTLTLVETFNRLVPAPSWGNSSFDPQSGQLPKVPSPQEEQQAEEERTVEELPRKFLLRGPLAAVRRVDDQTYVYLGDAWYLRPYSRSASGPKSMRAVLAVGQVVDEAVAVACIVFKSRDLVTQMADYRIGQPVSAVVQRHEWAQGGQPPPRIPTPQSRFDTRLSHVRTVDGRNPYWKEFCRFGDADALFWCCLGEGIEKDEDPSTWIDPVLGRSARSGNESALKRSWGTILRDPARFSGTRGLLEGQFAGLLPISPAMSWMDYPPRDYVPPRPTNSEPVLVLLRISDTLEGSITVVASLGNKASAREFGDYRYGVTVEADATVLGTFDALDQLWPVASQFYTDMFALPRSAAPKGGFDYDSPFERLGRNPLAAPLSLRCNWIQVKGKSATLVFADGPRRQGVTGRTAKPVVNSATNQNRTVIKPAATN
jgi:hypothetical protein